MARDAGFAVVANLSQGVINEIIAAYWTNLVPLLPFTLPATQVGGETVTFQGEVQVLPVTIALTPRPDNLIATTVAVGGYYSAQVGSAEPVSAVIQLSATINVGVTVVTASGYFVPTLDLSNAVLPSLAITVEQGPALPATVNQALNSSTVLGAVQAAIQAIPQNLLGLGASTIPDTLTAEGVTANFGNVTVVPMAGYLAVAADLLGYTQGDASQLVSLIASPAPMPLVKTNTSQGTVTSGGGIGSYSPIDCNVSATVNGTALLAFLNGPVAAAICSTALPGGASIDSVNFALSSYQLPLDATWWPGVIVNASASDDGFSASVTVDFSVYLVQSDDGTTPPSWIFRAANVTISLSALDDILAAAATAVVGFVLPPVAPLLFVALAVVLETVVPSLISTFEADAQNAINLGITSSTSFGSSLPYWNTSALPGASNASLSVETVGIVISQTGFDSYTHVSAVAANGGDPTLSLAGATLMQDAYGDYFYSAVPQDWTLTVAIPNNGALNQFPTFLNLTDPAIHVAWSVTGPNIDSAQFASDEQIAISGALTKTIQFNPNDPGFLHNTGLTMTVTIYRLIGSTHWPIWSSSIATSIFDELDITYNYVHWNHPVWFEKPGIIGLPAFSEFWTRKRKSVIHKTARTQRCKNVVTAVLAALKSKEGTQLNYIDTLPFPDSEAEEKRRGNLCDYCFFGGPHGKNFTP